MNTDIIIRHANKNDLSAIEKLFDISVREAYRINGISDIKDLNKHISMQINNFKNFIEGRDNSDYLVAIDDNKLVGIMALGKAQDIHIDNLGGDATVPLLRSAYVLPDYQGIGIGTKLFDSLVAIMKKRNIKTFYIDAGYRISQGYWKRKLGEPTLILKKYFGNGDDFLLWKVDVDALHNQA